jgi:uncharacterized repeat protein (TIGR01451 family)
MSATYLQEAKSCESSGDQLSANDAAREHLARFTCSGLFPMKTIVSGTLLLFLAGVASASTFTVSSTADSGPGSFRQAIVDSAAAASPLPDKHLITFAIGAGGVQVIRPITPLPPLVNTSVDGSTQTGDSSAPRIVIDGSLLSAANGLDVTNGDVTALSVINFAGGSDAGIGVLLRSGRLGQSWIGVAPSGEAGPNRVGVDASGSVGSCVISGNTEVGIVLRSQYSSVGFSYIGVDRASSRAIPNGTGIVVLGISTSIDYCTVSGNSMDGIVIEAPGASLQADLIGTNNVATAAIPNGRYGVVVNAAAQYIGIDEGSYYRYHSVISGNAVAGVLVDGGRVSIGRTEIGVNSSVMPIPNGSGIIIRGDAVVDILPETNIAYNSVSGIRVESSTAHVAYQPRVWIHHNGLLGFDLGTEGPSSSLTPVFKDAVRVPDGRLRLIADYPATPGSLVEFKFHSNSSCGALGLGQAEFVSGFTKTRADEYGVAHLDALTRASNATIIVFEEGRPISEYSECAQPVDQSSAGTFQFADNVTVSESAGYAELEIVRSGSSAGLVDVWWSTPQVASSVIRPASGIIHFVDGQTSAKIRIEIIDDAAPEADDVSYVTMAVMSSRGVDGLKTHATITITDDDAKPTLSLADTEVSEKNEDTWAEIPVTLSAPTSETVTCSYVFENLTGYEGIDPHPRPFTIAPFETRGVLAITVRGDHNYVGDRTFRLKLTSCNGATIANGSAMVTIHEDEPVPSRIADVAITITGPPSVTKGSVADYSVTVRNLGPDEASNVTIEGFLEPAFEWVRSSPNVSCSAAGPIHCSIPSIASGGEVNFTVTLLHRGESLRSFAVGVFSDVFDPDERNNHATVTVNVLLPSTRRRPVRR